MRGKHGRHIKDAQKVADKLRAGGAHFEADAISRLCKSSIGSMVENQRTNREYLQLLARNQGAEVLVQDMLRHLTGWAAEHLTDESLGDWSGYIEPTLNRARAMLKNNSKQNSG